MKERKTFSHLCEIQNDYFGGKLDINTTFAIIRVFPILLRFCKVGDLAFNLFQSLLLNELLIVLVTRKFEVLKAPLWPVWCLKGSKAIKSSLTAFITAYQRIWGWLQVQAELFKFKINQLIVKLCLTRAITSISVLLKTFLNLWFSIDRNSTHKNPCEPERS